MRIYLSIDLDYWKTGRRPEQFLNRVKALRKPIKVTEEHHDLLSHMNSFSYDCLINIDWHSDLCENIPDFPILKDGTWANHIRAGNRNQFIWIYPSYSCVEGRDNSSSTGYCNALGKYNPFLVRDPLKVCGWNRVNKRKRFITEEEMSQVIGVGICLSPAYTSQYTLDRAKEHLKKLELFEKAA